MAKILFGNKVVAVGTLSNINVKEKAVEADFSYEDWDKDSKKSVTKSESIAFVDNQYVTWTERFKNHDYAGSKIAIMFSVNKDKNYGNAMYYNSSLNKLVYKNNNGEDKTTYIYVGRAVIHEEDFKVVQTANGGERARISIPVSKRVDGENVTEWVNVSFWNNEDNKLADRAVKAIKNKDTILLVMSEPKPFGEKGTLYSNAYRFEIVERAKKEDANEEVPGETETPEKVFDDFTDSDDDYPF